MDPLKMRAADQRLEGALCNVVELLRESGEDFWKEKLERTLGDIRMAKKDTEYLQGEIESWFGGMGSLNDLIIAKENGHNVSDEEAATLNRKLDRARLLLYQEVQRP
ncbi:DUF6966 domain-containing protein [Jannaschia aquimarina]|uniref:DUF6966 domain-containing protein n=1 Tax=Jannaschia aquimarina TaxID=935700 RepID=UPI0011328D49|nr:hypothetical protein [Jannaschia aquimarina]